MTTDVSILDRARGCLLGGAVGDALGAPVEFLSLSEIRNRFGQAGLEEFAPAYGRIGAITDDTQMTLFAAEGLIRAQVRYAGRGICHPPSVIHHALVRWLYTQGERSVALQQKPDGWLVEQQALWARRAPGATCLSALRATTQFGEPAGNDSKGCGAIMRISPIGLFVKINDEHSQPNPAVCEMACESARSTHGHIDSTLSSGFFALLIALLLRRSSLSDAIATSRRWVEAQEGSAGVLAAVAQATHLARAGAAATPEIIEGLGQGWVAEEALAISLFCALRAKSFEYGVRLAVNHGGDSDSTGSLTGQLLGTMWGASVIPSRWLQQLELREVIEEIARDLVSVAEDCPSEELWPRYPGW